MWWAPGVSFVEFSEKEIAKGQMFWPNSNFYLEGHL